MSNIFALYQFSNDLEFKIRNNLNHSNIYSQFIGIADFIIILY